MKTKRFQFILLNGGYLLRWLQRLININLKRKKKPEN